MTNKPQLVLGTAALLLLTGFSPAKAYQYTWDCRGHVVWNSSNVTFEPSLVSFPQGSALQAAIEASRTAWNVDSPGTNYRIQHTWTTATTSNPSDGHNQIQIAAPADWAWGDALAVTRKRRTTCNIWPFSRARLAEADILFNPNPRDPFGFPTFWDTALNPAPPHPQGPFNVTLVAIHEHGHAFGLEHEDDVMATLNAFYPNSGVLGNDNDVHPHADDVLADRAGYGTPVTSRDFAASTFRRTGAGTSDVIPAPFATNRNAFVGFQFTVENRGTTNQSGVQVRFVLSPDRVITAGDFQVGTTTLSINSGVSSTLTANVLIPANAPTGNQFLGWVMDPTNTVAESDEGNNAVALTAPTNVRANRTPTACFSANPTSGPEPLPVTFDGSCSSDPDGDPLTYSWQFGDGDFGSGVNPFHVYFTQGFFSVSLTVTDPSGASSTTFGSVNVFCVDQGPGGELCPQPQ